MVFSSLQNGGDRDGEQECEEREWNNLFVLPLPAMRFSIPQGLAFDNSTLNLSTPLYEQVG